MLIRPGISARRRTGVSRTGRRLRHIFTIAAFIGPFLLLLVVFQYLPVATMLRDSLDSYQLLNPDDRLFVGLDNYRALFTDPDTLQSFAVTFIFAAGTVAVVIPLSFLLAVYLNGRLPLRAVIRTVVFLPVMTSAVVIATMWTFLLDPANGLLNGALAGLGLPRLAFLTSKLQALPSVILVTVWQQLGFATVLFLSGLQGIPAELEDAARVDGASNWQFLRHVVVPLLGRTTLFVVVIMTVFAAAAPRAPPTSSSTTSIRPPSACSSPAWPPPPPQYSC
jgi:ABC-type sugar transport system permease subunit